MDQRNCISSVRGDALCRVGRRPTSGNCLAVAATAGLGQIEGAAVTALLIGLARAFAIYTYPELEVLVPYLLMVIVLLVRPLGLFGTSRARTI